MGSCLKKRKGEKSKVREREKKNIQHKNQLVTERAFE